MIDFSDTIILTGAGFTANFGGWLANQMWSKIFSNPMLVTATKIKEELRSNFDFEEIHSLLFRYDPKYGKLFANTGQYPSDEISGYTESLTMSFVRMDEQIKAHNENKDIQINKVKKFLFEIMRNHGDKKLGYFTLNQDTFPENNFNWKPYGPLNYQEVHASKRTTNGIILPNDFTELNKYVHEGQVCYFKLHGSIDWFDGEKENAMIVGFNKKELIENIALLNWYFSIFKDAINREGVKLMIIGYGFRDKHINDCILSAINKYGLKLVVISPSNPEGFKNKLIKKFDEVSQEEIIDEDKLVIWKNIYMYIQNNLSSTFTNSKEISPEHADLRYTFTTDLF